MLNKPIISLFFLGMISCTNTVMSVGGDTAPDTDTVIDMNTDTNGEEEIVAASYSNNPIVQTLYTADPAPLVFDGTLYLYTSHDEDETVDDFFTMNDWRLYSTRDMLNWTDHGAVLRYDDFEWAKRDAWAGQVVHRNGKFYYYVPINKGARRVIGVAVSDSPTGPFEDPLGEPLITSDCGDIDPTVFVDDDGRAYLYWGNPKLCYVELNDDMISYEGEVVHVEMTVESFGARDDTARPTSYEEGPWLYKRGDLYYLVYAAGPISEHIAYATAPSATGPWTYGGEVMPTKGSAFTNHPGVVDFKGNSYFFYHNGALPGGGGYHRSVCFEKFSYNDDGTFPTIDMSEKGPPGVGVVDPYRINEAETIAWASGIETEPCDEGGMNVTSVDDGDSIRVAGVDFTSGPTAFEARVASDGVGGTIELRIDSETASPIGTCEISDTGGAQTWTTVTCPVSKVKDIHDLYFTFAGEGDGLFNFNYWRFIADGGNQQER